ncbi:MAG TPA: Fe-S cluster assembly protein SufD [Candidatus Angelobacter sp.]|jgi:Fe-S cluster assembly protein SufD|nr:Fe-S cluster assembly protein SufD [Candidatus Angelobacter sp.]
MSFTRTAVEELSALRGEPEWLRARRLESFGVFEGMSLPDTKRQEDWRQVDLKGLDLNAYAPFQQPNGAAPAAALGELSGMLLQRGTSAPAVELDPALARQGVLFLPLGQAAQEHRELVERYLFTGIRGDRDKFAALHEALFSGGTLLYVPDGVAVEQPLVSQFRSGNDTAAVLPHSLVIAGKGSRFQYVDEFLSADPQAALLASGSTEVFLEEGANVGYVALQQWSNRTWQFANQHFQLGRDAQLRMVDVALGGRFSRLRVEASLEGAGSSAELRGLFFGTGEQAYDFRTLQDHIGPHTTSDLLFKGALRDLARSVYVGVVRVEPEARGSSSNQANRNLLLSEKARATSEPILEILNNDILRCSHGATVGPVDPEHLFYLESRGIPRSVAEQMLVQGFLGEVLDRLRVQQVRDAVERELAARIE